MRLSVLAFATCHDEANKQRKRIDDTSLNLLNLLDSERKATIPMSPPQSWSPEKLRQVIADTWGFRELRPFQHEAMGAILDRRDSLVVLPTGGGKSLCYQAPAVYRGGTTLVISPLIALMKDQVDSLRAVGVAAAQFDSSLTADALRLSKRSA